MKYLFNVKFINNIIFIISLINCVTKSVNEKFINLIFFISINFYISIFN